MLLFFFFFLVISSVQVKVCYRHFCLFIDTDIREMSGNAGREKVNRNFPAKLNLQALQLHGQCLNMGSNEIQYGFKLVK